MRSSPSRGGSPAALLESQSTDAVSACAQNCYTGADKSMLIPNTLFRVGGAAVILTNRITERRRAKYELQHVVRVHMGHIDMAYE